MDAPGDVGIQTCEDLGEVGAVDLTGSADPDLREEGLVELPADRGGRIEVGGVAVAGEVERPVDRGFGVSEGRRGQVEESLGVVEFTGDALLLGLEQVERDGVVVVGLEELGALVGKSVDPSTLTFELGVGAGSSGSELSSEFDLR